MALVDTFLNTPRTNLIPSQSVLIDRSTGSSIVASDNIVDDLLGGVLGGWDLVTPIESLIDDLLGGIIKKGYELPNNIGININDDNYEAPSSIVITVLDTAIVGTLNDIKSKVIEDMTDPTNGLTEAKLSARLAALNKIKAEQSDTGGIVSDFITDLINNVLADLFDIRTRENEINPMTFAELEAYAFLNAKQSPVTIQLDGLTIRLPMPMNISESMKQDWSGAETQSFGAEIMGAVQNASDASNQNGATGKKSSIVSGNSSGIDTTTTIRAIRNAATSAVAGENALNLDKFQSKQIINSKREVLYLGHDFRSFSYEFEFAPKNELDVIETMAIIKGLKYASSPGLTAGGELVTYPSLFKVEFLNNKGENFGLSIPEAAMTEMTVNYTPDGLWSAFKSGFPLHVKLNMSFMETDLVYRDDIHSVDN